MGFMEGFKWLRIQGHIPSYESTPREQGRTFLSEDKIFYCSCRREKENFLWGSAINESSTKGNKTNCLKSRGCFSLEHLDF